MIILTLLLFSLDYLSSFFSLSIHPTKNRQRPLLTDYCTVHTTKKNPKGMSKKIRQVKRRQDVDTFVDPLASLAFPCIFFCQQNPIQFNIYVMYIYKRVSLTHNIYLLGYTQKKHTRIKKCVPQLK